MTKRIFIANLVKRYNIYTNLQLNKVVNQFNRSQKNLHLDLAHYEVDRFFQHFKHNQLHLGYVTHPGHTKYYDHAEDALRRAELTNLASMQRRHADGDHDAEQSDIEYFTPQRIDLMLTRFGPLFNHNGISVCRAAQEVGISVTNAAQGIANCRDKWQAYRMVSDLVPLVNSSFANWETLKNLPKNALSYPRITKPHAHSLGGQNVHLAHNQLQLVQQAYHLDEFDFTLNQDFIATNPNSSYDLRVLCINGEVAGSYIRLSPQESIVANIAQGGVGIPYSIDPILQRQALAIVERLGLDICGLDFIYNSKTSQWQFLEANACPGYQGFDEVLGRNFAEEILNYCVIRTTGHNLEYFRSQELSEEQLGELQRVDRWQAQQLQAQWRKDQQFAQIQTALERAISELVQAEPRAFLKLLEAKLSSDCEGESTSKNTPLRELETNEITRVTQLLHGISDLCVYFQQQLAGCEPLLEQLHTEVARLAQEEMEQAIRPQRVMLIPPTNLAESSTNIATEVTLNAQAPSTTTAAIASPAQANPTLATASANLGTTAPTMATLANTATANTPAHTVPTAPTAPTILAGAIGISKVGLHPNLQPTPASGATQAQENVEGIHSGTSELESSGDDRTTSADPDTSEITTAEIADATTRQATTDSSWCASETTPSTQACLDCTQLQELYRAWREYCWNPLSNVQRHPSNGFPMLPSPQEMVQQAEAQLLATPKKKFKD